MLKTSPRPAPDQPQKLQYLQLKTKPKVKPQYYTPSIYLVVLNMYFRKPKPDTIQTDTVKPVLYWLPILYQYITGTLPIPINHSWKTSQYPNQASTSRFPKLVLVLYW